MSIVEIKKSRKEKLKSFEKEGIDPYPLKTKRSFPIERALADFNLLSKSGKSFFLAGRIRSVRSHGGSTFIHFEDGTGRIQAFFRKNKVGKERYIFFLNNFDIGDFIEIKGNLFKTKKGEKTIEAKSFKILAKSILPLPEKWHGLKDTEERYRKRYLDFIFNPEVKEKFKIRAEIIKRIREFLDNESFLEVETPFLHSIYGGARAKPFKTHLNALDMSLYLRIATELYLKRLLVGGFDKVYEIGKCFRNEGMDKYHNPEYTHFEFYWAYADYEQLMKLTEKMFKYVLKNIFGSYKITYGEKEINFKTPWKRVEFSDLLKKHAKVDLSKVNQKEIFKKAKELNVKVEKEMPKAEIADEIYKKFCRAKIKEPTFVIHHPTGFQPLAKKLDDDSEKLANFQLVIGGIELANAFSELNDPIEQRKRFKEQEKLHKEGLEEAQRMDNNFLEALEHGMPPAAGFGMGIDRLTMLLTNSQNLREVILFPTMKPKDK
jgi:lysyl-tRNA synthetase, class II